MKLLHCSTRLLNMQFHLLKFIFLLFISISIIILYHPTASVLAQDQDLNTSNVLYENCSPFRCGNITNITYPFWASDRPAYCGLPGFQLNCSAQALVEISQLSYRILRINYSSTTLTVARTDYQVTFCPESLDRLSNATLDPKIFNYASNPENITLYYGCPASSAGGQNSSQAANEFTCDVEGRVSAGYFLAGNRTLSRVGVNVSLERCSDNVVVPVSKSAVAQLEKTPTQKNLMEALNEGFELKWNANDSRCKQCMSSGGRCGYNTTTASFACYCPESDQANPFSCLNVPPAAMPTVQVPSEVIIVVASAIFGGCLVCCCLSTRKGRVWVELIVFGLKKTKENENIERFITNYQTLREKRYSYWDVTRMTNSFVDKLGQGGFGGVYKGKLPDGRLVAVKVLNKTTGDGEEFVNEVATISRTSHVNIVTLLGFCFERTKRALIYEYLPNGSLDTYINGHGSKHLEWKHLYEIAIGIARGLEYLHSGCNTRIVHFDIKPQNILLDENFCPKISDFGLAKLCKGRESIVSMLDARGTIGYIAPEVFMREFGGVSYKSDVYSYGMMIIKMFGSKNTNIYVEGSYQNSEIYFSDWIYKHLEPGMIFRVHQNVSEEEEKTVRRMIIVGLWCIQVNPSDRPSMTKVVEMLEASLESLPIPPKTQIFSATNTTPVFSSMASSLSSSTYLSSKKEGEMALRLAEDQ